MANGIPGVAQPQLPQPGQRRIGQMGQMAQIDPATLNALMAVIAQQQQKGQFLSPRGGGFLGPARETRHVRSFPGGGPRVFQQGGSPFPVNNNARIFAQIMAIMNNAKLNRGGAGGTQERKDAPALPAERGAGAVVQGPRRRAGGF